MSAPKADAVTDVESDIKIHAGRCVTVRSSNRRGLVSADARGLMRLRMARTLPRNAELLKARKPRDIAARPAMPANGYDQESNDPMQMASAAAR